jgi:hypothetical protein
MNKAVAPQSIRNVTGELLTLPARRMVATELVLTVADRTSSGVEVGIGSGMGVEAGVAEVEVSGDGFASGNERATRAAHT